MNDSLLRDALVGIYKQLRIQQEMLMETALEVEALSSVLQSSPDFRQYYDKAREAQKNGPTAQKLSVTLQAIDSAIGGLMQAGTKPQQEN
jgi:hypothetical protein